MAEEKKREDSDETKPNTLEDGREMLTVWVFHKRLLKSKLALDGKKITQWIQEQIDNYLAE
jgi:hypothetical protein